MARVLTSFGVALSADDARRRFPKAVIAFVQTKDRFLVHLLRPVHVPVPARK